MSQLSIMFVTREIMQPLLCKFSEFFFDPPFSFSKFRGWPNFWTILTYLQKHILQQKNVVAGKNLPYIMSPPYWYYDVMIVMPQL